MNTVSFLANFKNIMQSKFTWKTPAEALNPENLLKTFDWIVAYLLEKTAGRVESLRKQGLGGFENRNGSQVFYARNLAISYAQVRII